MYTLIHTYTCKLTKAHVHLGVGIEINKSLISEYTLILFIESLIIVAFGIDDVTALYKFLELFTIKVGHYLFGS